MEYFFSSSIIAALNYYNIWACIFLWRNHPCSYSVLRLFQQTDINSSELLSLVCELLKCLRIFEHRIQCPKLAVIYWNEQITIDSKIVTSSIMVFNPTYINWWGLMRTWPHLALWQTVAEELSILRILFLWVMMAWVVKTGNYFWRSRWIL